MPIRPKTNTSATTAIPSQNADHSPQIVGALPSPPTAAPIIVRSRVRRPALPQPSLARSVAPAPKRRGHATKDEKDKWQPTGNYEAGWCRPPEATRFKAGGRPGPGRPKGSVSHDTLLKRQLDQKQRVRINGREQNVTLRELIAKKTVMAAVEGKDRDARKYVLTESARLFAAKDDRTGAALPVAELNASDALSIEEFMADLRRELRAEIEEEMASQGSEDAS